MNEWLKLKTDTVFYNFEISTIMFLYDSSMASALRTIWIKRVDLCFIRFYCKHVFVFEMEFDFRMKSNPGVPSTVHWVSLLAFILVYTKFGLERGGPSWGGSQEDLGKTSEGGFGQRKHLSGLDLKPIQRLRGGNGLERAGGTAHVSWDCGSLFRRTLAQHSFQESEKVALHNGNQDFSHERK